MSDVLIIGTHVGAAFILVRAGVTTEGKITQFVKRLNHTGIAFQDVMVNDLPLRPCGYSYKFTDGHVAQLGMDD